MKADSRTALRVIGVANLIFCAVGLFFALPIYWQEYRNPQNPADIRAEVGYNVHYFAVPIFISGVAALFGVLALIFFLLARAGRNREPTQAATT